MTDLHPMAADGFGRSAPVYARGRPGFPPASLDWLQQDLAIGPGQRVVEVGAGTGKFTRLLTQTGADVLAVDPVAPMLEQLAAEQPRVKTLLARAQELPLANESADAVICAQSFHWFATNDALREIRRILKPGGVLGLIWNVRDESVDWVAALTRIMSPHEGDAPRYYKGEWRAVFPMEGFSPFEERHVNHAHTGSPEQVIVDRVTSVSFIAALPAQTRNQVVEQLRALIRDTPGLAGKADISLPYVTQMYWCRAGRG
jgi:SAM-dependent methyltransferase